MSYLSFQFIFTDSEHIKSYLIKLGYNVTNLACIIRTELGLKIKDQNITSNALYEPLCYKFDEDYQRIVDYTRLLLSASRRDGRTKRIGLNEFYGYGLNIDIDPYYGFLNTYRASSIFKTRLRMLLKKEGILSKNHGLYYERNCYLP